MDNIGVLNNKVYKRFLVNFSRFAEISYLVKKKNHIFIIPNTSIPEI